ncbi:MAG TPA: hypothetical protein PKO36_16385 [Candidatus Hydrogenedentes bacterium]|nr:hypothetical protein [Candidatus Hydrogenedentota bacterium]HOT49466.1 hypothetical protein [Candidatus Hydrogenedentota bacterium]HOV75731.1 hypothetical protein [Candidatus Hydrogenedentota bacterium]HPC16060.1 hypothetical protein [Candidatus Hydrogenedentota bacterium]HRT20014.1 hypothetical protein [Candidatus Hydrogenedentota bacterium]
MVKKIVLIVVLCLIAAVVVAALVVDSKFGVIWGSPRIPHATLVKPETRAMLSVDVPRAKDFIKRQFLKNLRVPDSVIPYALPYEAGLIVTPDYVLGEMNMTLFVNDRRLAPVIADKVNGFKLPAPMDEWFTEKMAAKQRGLLRRDGTAKMDKLFLAKLKTLWNKPAPGDTLKIEGGHTLELVLDNRDGSLLAMASAVASAKGFDLSTVLTEGRMGVFTNIGSIRLQGDILPDDSIKLLLTVECTPEAEEAMAKVLGMALEMGFNQLQMMAKMKGISIEGKAAVEGKRVRGEYTLTNVIELLN